MSNVNEQKINLLRKLKDNDEEAEQLFDIICLWYPMLLDDPKSATTEMVNGYNRLVKCNISNAEIRSKLLIS